MNRTLGHQGDEDVEKKLMKFEVRINKGIERSFIYKQKLADRAAQEAQKVKPINLTAMEQKECDDRWMQYLLRRQKYEEKMKERRKN